MGSESTGQRIGRYVRAMHATSRLGRRLQLLGGIGVTAAVLVAVGGFLLAGRASSTAVNALGPLIDLSTDVAETIDATGVMVGRTTDAIVAIEDTTRSTGRALGGVSEALQETAALVEGDIADSLDSAIGTLPGLISTASVIDGTMRALSFVGVDYDPDQPLDDALRDLEDSLQPIPGQVRAQSESMRMVSSDIDQIVVDSGELAAVLLATRVDMISAGETLASASANANEAVAQMKLIQSDIDTYENLTRFVFLAAAIALGAVSTAPILIGRTYSDPAGDQNLADGDG